MRLVDTCSLRVAGGTVLEHPLFRVVQPRLRKVQPCLCVVQPLTPAYSTLTAACSTPAPPRGRPPPLRCRSMPLCCTLIHDRLLVIPPYRWWVRRSKSKSSCPLILSPACTPRTSSRCYPWRSSLERHCSRIGCSSNGCV